MGSLVERVGVPVVEHAGTAREVALTLLGVAAEVEQALMVQYIYAAVSVADFPAMQSDLTLVCTLATDARSHFSRDASSSTIT